MSLNIENILREHWGFLRGKTTNCSAILAELYSRNIFSQEEIDLIKNPFRNATTNDTYDCLYNTLVRKNVSPEVLKNILLGTSNEHIVEKVWVNFSKDLDEDFKFWNVGLRNDNFTGRLKILEDLENHLESKLWENSTSKIVLCGMGGVGKTTIVTEFLYRNRQKFSHIFWFVAEENMNLVQKIFQLAKKLKFDNDPIEQENKMDFAKRFITNWFEKKSGWLIVYDNVEDFEDIQNFIPRFGGILLVTSRNKTYWADFNRISVNFFDKSESCEFIQIILKFNDYLKFEELSFDLGYLPLAISNACHYIKGNEITIEEYLDYSKIAQVEFLKICPNFKEKSVWISVKISLDKTKEKCPLAFEFLQIISFLQAEDIPKLILQEFVELKKINKMQIIEIQKFILKYDLVKLEIRGENQLYSIHRLVQKSIKLSLENEFQILQISSQIIKNVCHKYEALDTKYILHHTIHLLLYLIEFAQESKNAQDISQLQILNRTIFDLINYNDYSLFSWLSEIKDLDKIFTKYFKAMELLIVDPKNIYELNMAMGRCFLVKEDFQNASQMYEKLLKICRDIFGENSHETSLVYNNIGVCCAKLSQFSKAQEFYEKSLNIEIELQGVDSNELIPKFNNLGYVCIDLKEYKKAQEYFDKALHLVHKHQLQDSFHASFIFGNLGKVCFELNYLKNAREYYNKHFEILEKLYGENSLKVFKRLKLAGDHFVNLNASFALEFYQNLSDSETKFLNGSSEDTLNKIRICKQKILEQN